MTTLDDLSRDDLLAILQRDRVVKEQLAGRIGGLTAENCELLVVIDSMSRDLTEARELLAQAQAQLAPADD